MRAFSLLILASLCWAAAARAGDDTKCMAEIAAAERTMPLPSGALRSIALVESGRPIGSRVVPWPWSVNAAGVGRYYASKAEAIGQVEALQASGLQSIDVGCMQVNLASHRSAFRSLDDAFEPAVNVGYAARFFMSLYQQTGRWTLAMTSYHSQTPALAAEYGRRLAAVWPQAAAYGLGAANGPEPVREPPRLGPIRSEGSSSLLAAALPVHGRAWPSMPMPR